MSEMFEREFSDLTRYEQFEITAEFVEAVGGHDAAWELIEYVRTNSIRG